jgi:hypothetical protein
MATRPAKWKVVENVVAAIERSLNSVQGTRVIPNASVPEMGSGKLRQVDALVEIPTGPRTLRVAVEVQDRGRAMDLPALEQLAAKIGKLDVDSGCIVARSGFTADATAEAKRLGIELKEITEVGELDWCPMSAFSLQLRRIEVIHVQMVFQEPNVSVATELTAGLESGAISMTSPHGKARTLHEYAKSEAIRSMEDPRLQNLADQEQFMVVVDLREATGFSMSCQNGDLPLPAGLVVTCILHTNVDSVAFGPYEAGGGVDVLTCVSAELDKQLTMVAKLQPDGSRRLSISIDKPKPSATIVERRCNST